MKKIVVSTVSAFGRVTLQVLNCCVYSPWTFKCVRFSIFAFGTVTFRHVLQSNFEQFGSSVGGVALDVFVLVW